MDVQSAPPTYTPMGMPRPPVGNPPVLGQQVPGMSGGLPAQGGLSVLQNPMAQELQSQGRQGDSTLVHMNPEEVSGLQALAMAHGTSMTINPITGLPEAFKLGKIFKKLLPTLLGAGLTFIPGIGPLAAAGLVGGGFGIASGSLKKGLLAGLSAYGGASLAGALAPAAAGNVATTGAANAAGAAGTAGTTAAPVVADATSLAANIPGATAETMGTAIANNTAASLGAAASQAAPLTVNAAGLGANMSSMANSAANPGFLTNFANAARAGLPTGTPGIITKNIPMIAGGAVLNDVSKAFSPGQKTPGGQIDNSYTGPYTAQERKASFAPDTQSLLSSSKERRYFDVDMPEIYDMQGRTVQQGTSTEKGAMIYQPMLNPRAKKNQNQYIWQATPYMMAQEQQMPSSVWEAIAQQGIGNYRGGISGYAHGGEVPMDNGAFVMDARSVSEIGNGSSNAGKEILARLGGRPVEGPGDGVSDSVPASIGGSQKARVARDEVIFPAAAVKRLGKGNPQRGTDKLYALMDKAHKARKKAGRGQDTGLRKGLA